MVPVRLPAEAWRDVDEGVEALLDRWLVREGDRVTSGQPVAAVVVMKANYEVTAPAAGRIAKLLVPEQGTFGRNQDLALVE